MMQYFVIILMPVAWKIWHSVLKKYCNFKILKQLASNTIPYDAIFCHCFAASCFEIWYFLITNRRQIQEFKATDIKYRLCMLQYFWLFWCQLIGNRLFCNKQIIENTRFPSKWREIQFHMMQDCGIDLMPVARNSVIL
jgi:hypothetical protein